VLAGEGKIKGGNMEIIEKRARDECELEDERS